MSASLTTDPVSAVASAVNTVATDAQPVITQATAQAYLNAYKARIATAQAALAALEVKPNDPGAIAAFSAVLQRMCNDAGFIRSGGVQPCISLGVQDLAIFLQSLARNVEQSEQLTGK